jgi:hypothetical protein
MEIKKIAFADVPKNAPGIVIRGCDLSTLENCMSFISGVMDELIESKVIPQESEPEQIWKKLCSLNTTGGRTDLIFIAKKDAPIDYARFAIARLRIPDCSWIEDWLVNSAKDFASFPRGPHAHGFIAGNTNDE